MPAASGRCGEDSISLLRDTNGERAPGCDHRSSFGSYGVGVAIGIGVDPDFDRDPDGTRWHPGRETCDR
jgi:hypothetical protein